MSKHFGKLQPGNNPIKVKKDKDSLYNNKKQIFICVTKSQLWVSFIGLCPDHHQQQNSIPREAKASAKERESHRGWGFFHTSRTNKIKTKKQNGCENKQR